MMHLFVDDILIASSQVIPQSEVHPENDRFGKRKQELEQDMFKRACTKLQQLNDTPYAPEVFRTARGIIM